MTDLATGEVAAIAAVHDHIAHHHHDEGQPSGHLQRNGLKAEQLAGSVTLRLEHDVLAKNNELAARNRAWLAARHILALNLVSSPGAGKTTLLVRTIRDLGNEFSIEVIEGDQASTNDAKRVQLTGARVVQINTGTVCHLDAAMVARGLLQLDPPRQSLLLIENVGNLVCPSLFDLGELAKVVVVSVTEGDDKPVKYPHMFRASQVLILNKIDLLPYVDFDVDRFLECAAQVNPALRIFQVSATRGDGLESWYAWLRQQRTESSAFRHAVLQA